MEMKNVHTHDALEAWNKQNMSSGEVGMGLCFQDAVLVKRARGLHDPHSYTSPRGSFMSFKKIVLSNDIYKIHK